MYLAVLIYLFGCLKNLEDTLFCQCRSKDNREINKRSHTTTDRIFEGSNNLLILILNKIPLIHNNNKALVITLNKLEDIHILRLYTTGCIQHKDTNIRVLYTPDGTHDTIKL